MSLTGMGFDCKSDFTPPTVLLGLLLFLGHGISFFGGIQCSPVDGCSATGCNFEFLQEKMSARPSTPSSCYSWCISRNLFCIEACMHTKLLQLCPTLCNPTG